MGFFKDGLKRVSDGMKTIVNVVRPKPKPGFGVDDLWDAAGDGLKDLGEGVVDAGKAVGEGVADAGKAVGSASLNAVGEVADGLDKVGDSANAAIVKAGKATVGAAGFVIDEAIDAGKAVGEKTKPLTDKVGDVLEPVGEAAGKVLKPIGEGAKDLGENVVEGVKDAGEAIGDASKPIIDKVEDFAEPIVDKVGDVVQPVAAKVGDVVQPVASKVGDVLEPVGEGAMKVLKPVGRTVASTLEHTFHFLSTGDFGMVVKKLTEEQEAAINRYDIATTERLVAANAVVAAKSKLAGISVAYADQWEQGDGQFRGHGGRDRLMPNASQRVDPDLYGNDSTETLEDIGLDPVAKFLKVKNEWFVMMPWEIAWKQDDLEELRAQLRKNIDDFSSAADWLENETRNLEKTKTRLDAEIVEAEKRIEAAGLSDEVSVVSALRAQEVENDTRLSIARAFIESGMDPEEIATVTGVELEVIQAMAAEAAET